MHQSSGIFYYIIRQSVKSLSIIVNTWDVPPKTTITEAVTEIQQHMSQTYDAGRGRLHDTKTEMARRSESHIICDTAHP